MGTVVVVVSITVAAALTLYMINAESKPPVISFDGTRLSVKSRMFEAALLWPQIKKLELVQALPKIVLRTNGYSAAGKRRGRFRVEGMGAGQLFVDEKVGSYIVATTEKSYVIFNAEDAHATQSLYATISERWGEHRS